MAYVIILCIKMLVVFFLVITMNQLTFVIFFNFAIVLVILVENALNSCQLSGYLHMKCMLKIIIKQSALR